MLYLTVADATGAGSACMRPGYRAPSLTESSPART
jgi:hypothetical protein